MRKHEVINEVLEEIPCTCHLLPKKQKVPCMICCKLIVLVGGFLERGCELPAVYDTKRAPEHDASWYFDRRDSEQ